MEPILLEGLKLVAGGITAGATGKLGESVIEALGRVIERMQLHSPETVKRLAAAESEAVIEGEIVEEVRRVAAQHPDVQTAMNDAAVAVKADQSSFQNLTKLADKIGSVNLGTIGTQNNTFNF